MRPVPGLRGPGRAIWLACFGLAIGSACSFEPRGPCNPDPAGSELGTICGFQNPEDVEVVALPALIVSEMIGERPGSLAAIDLRDDGRTPQRIWPHGHAPLGARPEHPEWLDPDCRTEPAPEKFAPHGIGAPQAAASARRALVAVVSHGEREAIEVFRLGRNPTGALQADWVGCLRLPARSQANDVVFAPDGSLLVTRERRSRWLAPLYAVIAGLGFDTGELLRKQPGRDWEIVPDSRGAYPNGLLESGGSLYFAQTGPGRITRIDAGGERRDVPIEGHPDNLSRGPAGSIRVVSHTDGIAFLGCALGRRPCRTAWSLLEVAPDSLRARVRLHHDGSVLGAAASVAQYGDWLFFGAVFGDRIGVLRASGNPAGGMLQSFWRPVRSSSKHKSRGTGPMAGAQNRRNSSAPSRSRNAMSGSKRCPSADELQTQDNRVNRE